MNKWKCLNCKNEFTSEPDKLGHCRCPKCKSYFLVDKGEEVKVYSNEEILEIVFKTIDEFHSRTCFWTHTENLKQTILDRLKGIEVKVTHKMFEKGKK